jgi:hypothetical protein
MRFDGNRIIYEWGKLYNKSFRIQKYLNRNEEIVRYFLRRPEQLLVIDLTKEINTNKIVEFLQLPKNMTQQIPHKNKT